MAFHHGNQPGNSIYGIHARRKGEIGGAREPRVRFDEITTTESTEDTEIECGEQGALIGGFSLPFGFLGCPWTICRKFIALDVLWESRFCLRR